MRDTIDMARYKQIPSCPDYWVDARGEVLNYRGRQLAQQVTEKGYCRVHLSINGETKSKSVHSLVAEAFIGPRPKGMEVCHKNGIRSDNTPENLRYATKKENEADKVVHGTVASGDRNGARLHPEKRPKGSLHGKSKLTEDDVVEIKKVLSLGNLRMGAELAKKFNVSISTISNINKGKVWKHI